MMGIDAAHTKYHPKDGTPTVDATEKSVRRLLPAGTSPANSRFPPRRLGVVVIGVVGTALLHTLLVLPFFLDLSLAPHRMPNHSGAGASALSSPDEALMTVVFINEVSAAVEPLARLEPRDLASRGVESPELPVLVLSPDASPARQSDAKSEGTPDTSLSDTAADRTQHAIFYGRYLGQVQARIERAWMRPRTEIGASQFSCRARVTQDRRGDVVDIRLDHCNGTARWQLSLESAIRTASPLPAPPDPSVYADRLWLTFQSGGFRPDGSPDGFEPENRQTVVAANQSQERESLEHLAERFGRRTQSNDKNSAKVINLTIIGTPNAAAQTTRVESSAQGIQDPPPLQ